LGPSGPLPSLTAELHSYTAIFLAGPSHLRSFAGVGDAQEGVPRAAGSALPHSFAWIDRALVNLAAGGAEHRATGSGAGVSSPASSRAASNGLVRAAAEVIDGAAQLGNNREALTHDKAGGEGGSVVGVGGPRYSRRRRRRRVACADSQQGAQTRSKLIREAHIVAIFD